MRSGSIFRARLRAAFALFLVSMLVFPACSHEKKQRKDLISESSLTIIFSSDLLGKIRSCGCAIEDMGGLGRNATYVENMRRSVPNLIVVNVGDVFSLDLSYSKTEAELTFDVFNLMCMDAFTPGELEFIFGLPFLEMLAERANFDILAANVVDSETGETVFGPAYAIRELDGGVRVGITGVLDELIRFPGYVDTSSFKIAPVAKTLRKIMPDLKEESDFLILLSHMGLERSRALAGEIPDFDLIVVGHGKPLIKNTEKIGKTFM
ncbi:MAG: bifunctional metallophosphatase/5'-nucleotidase, partial [Candidatus Krumholzibacteria bacterium]|nr:bifunctional metallophosphatase/5'-nucleotidase [Candidatus Krumholzibacteria bacterium]